MIYVFDIRESSLTAKRAKSLLFEHTDIIHDSYSSTTCKVPHGVTTCFSPQFCVQNGQTQRVQFPKDKETRRHLTILCFDAGVYSGRLTARKSEIGPFSTRTFLMDVCVIPSKRKLRETNDGKKTTSILTYMLSQLTFISSNIGDFGAPYSLAVFLATNPHHSAPAIMIEESRRRIPHIRDVYKRYGFHDDQIKGDVLFMKCQKMIKLLEYSRRSPNAVQV